MHDGAAKSPARKLTSPPAVSSEGFFGMLKRERVNRRCYQSHAEARADVFDYIERFYNLARERRLAVLEAAKRPLTNLSVETG